MDNDEINEAIKRAEDALYLHGARAYYLPDDINLLINAAKALKAENEKLRKQVQRWEDAHSEMIGEVELRARIAELEAIIEARGM